MKRLYFILLTGLMTINIHAQEHRRTYQSNTQNTDTTTLLQPRHAGVYTQPIVNGYLPGMPQAAGDSLNLPPLNAHGQVMPINMYPYSWGGWSNWNLHKGLNVSLSASVFGFFGKHAPSGAGFTQSLSAMYAMPLTPKLSLALGGYFNNMIWSHQSYRDAGLSAVLGYRFDEHWEAYLYGQKSLANTARTPYPLYDIGRLGDRIGAAVKYNFNPSFSIQLSVERGWMPKQQNIYFDQYNYPVPKP